MSIFSKLFGSKAPATSESATAVTLTPEAPPKPEVQVSDDPAPVDNTPDTQTGNNGNGGDDNSPSTETANDRDE